MNTVCKAVAAEQWVPAFAGEKASCASSEGKASTFKDWHRTVPVGAGKSAGSVTIIMKQAVRAGLSRRMLRPLLHHRVLQQEHRATIRRVRHGMR
jgi:hypothetical protein